MDKKEVADGLIEIIKPYLPEDVNPSELDESKNLIEDLKINSAHLVDIVLDVEEKFDIMIEDDVIGEMQTIGQAIEMIQDKMSEEN